MSVTLIAVDPERLEKAEKELAELKLILIQLNERLDQLLQQSGQNQEYELEYAMIPTVLKYTDYKERKIKQLANTYFPNGEAVIRTIRPNGDARGVQYKVSDIKDAPARYLRWKQEQQDGKRRTER